MIEFLLNKPAQLITDALTRKRGEVSSEDQRSTKHNIMAGVRSVSTGITLWGGFELFNPVLMASSKDPVEGINKIRAAQGGLNKLKTSIREIPTIVDVSAFTKKVLKTKINVDAGSLAALERQFRPFMESRLYWGTEVGSAYADIYALGIARTDAKKIVSETRVTTTVAALIASKTMNSSLLRTFSLYPALIGLARDKSVPIVTPLIQRRNDIYGQLNELTKFYDAYSRQLPRFKKMMAETMGIPEEQITKALKKGGLADLDEFKKVEQAINADRDRMKTLAIERNKLSDATEKVDLKKLKEIDEEIKGLHKRSSDLTELLNESNLFDKLPTHVVDVDGKLYATVGGKRRIIANESMSIPRAHGVKGRDLFFSRAARTAEESFGRISDEEAKRYDTRWLSIGADKSLYRRMFGSSVRTWSMRFIRLLDSPTDIFEMFGFSKTQAEEISEFRDLTRKLISHHNVPDGAVISVQKGRVSRLYEFLVKNRFGAGGEYNVSGLKLARNLLLPSFTTVEKKHKPIYVMPEGSVPEEELKRFKQLVLEKPSEYEAFAKKGGLGFAKVGDRYIVEGSEVISQVKRLKIGMLGIPLGFYLLNETYPVWKTPVQEAFRVRATVGEELGAHDYIRSVEENAPGTTSPGYLLGLAGTGFVAGATARWAAQTIEPVKRGLDSVIRAERDLMKVDVPSQAVRDIMKLFKINTVKKATTRAGLYGAAIGVALDLPFLPAQIMRFAFGTKGPEELKQEYQNKKPVPVMSGRWWEAGVTSFGGDKLKYYRPNFLSVSPYQARKKQLFGDKPNWFYIAHPLKKMFTYNVEKEHYYDRPYIETASAFSDTFGPLTPLVNATVGKIIKPIKRMHVSEYNAPYEGNTDSLSAKVINNDVLVGLPSKKGLTAVNELTSRNSKDIVYASKASSIGRVAREMLYRNYTEAPGIVGFGGTSYNKAMSGNDVILDNERYIESADRMVENRRAFWDLEVGGLIGTSEMIRRIYPSRRFSELWFNPLKNNQPKWMPGGNEMIDFTQGDPYTKIRSGELRVPGAGYALRRPDLKGVDPSKYSPITQMEILADIAPYSRAFKRSQEKALEMINKDRVNDSGLQRIKDAQKMREMRIRSYVYAKQSDKTSFVTGYGALLSEFGKSLPTEKLYPFSPAHKFMGRRTGIQAYEEYIKYTGDRAEWSKPFTDFIAKAASAITPMFSFSRQTEPTREVKKIRDIGFRLDGLKYLKAQKLNRGQSKSYTIAGLNPYRDNVFELQRSTPKGEKRFFFPFAEEDNYERQKVIISMVPEELKRIYKGIWARRLVEKAKRNETLITTRGIINRAASVISKLSENEFAYSSSKSEGAVRHDMAVNMIKRHGGGVPDNSWLGWNSKVNLNDMKFFMAEEEGIDYHDIGVWEPQIAEINLKDRLPGIYEELSQAGDRLQIPGIMSSDRSYDGAGYGEQNVEVNQMAPPDMILDSLSQ